MSKKLLHLIAKKLKTPCTNIGLLDGKMGIAIFLYHYAQHINCKQTEEFADKLIDEIIVGISKQSKPEYFSNLAGIGIGIEYLVQQKFICGESNEILELFDKHIHNALSLCYNQKMITKDVTIYGKYYIARLNNPVEINPSLEVIKNNLIKVLDLLSYYTYQDIFYTINFLPDVLSVDIENKKAGCFMNYAVDRLETMVYEDVFFKKYPENFNPLIAAFLLLRASSKIGNDNFKVSALYFLDNYELGFRQYLSNEHSVKWAFLYYFLSKALDSDIYLGFANQWFGKIITDSLNVDFENLIKTGMMLLSMDKIIDDKWLDWFSLN